jgi:hypothetical protein
MKGEHTRTRDQRVRLALDRGSHINGQLQRRRVGARRCNRLFGRPDVKRIYYEL